MHFIKFIFTAFILISFLDPHLALAQKRNKRNEKKTSDKIDSCVVYKAKYDSIFNLLNAKRKEYNVMVVENANLTDRINALKSDSNAHIKAMNRLDAITAEIAELNKQVKSKDSLVESFRLESGKLTNSIGDLNLKIDELNKRKVSDSMMLVVKNVEINNLSDTLSRLKNLNNSIALELKNSKNELEQKIILLSTWQTNITALELKIKSLKSKNTEIANEINSVYEMFNRPVYNEIVFKPSDNQNQLKNKISEYNDFCKSFSNDVSTDDIRKLDSLKSRLVEKIAAQKDNDWFKSRYVEMLCLLYAKQRYNNDASHWQEEIEKLKLVNTLGAPERRQQYEEQIKAILSHPHPLWKVK